MEKKKNSIDWLIEQMIIQLDIRIEDTTIGCDLFEQAKAMHKEEIEEAYMVGNHSEMRGGRAICEVTEKYYNETFGGQDNE